MLAYTAASGKGRYSGMCGNKKARTGRAFQGCFRSCGNMWKLAFGGAGGI